MSVTITWKYYREGKEILHKVVWLFPSAALRDLKLWWGCASTAIPDTGAELKLRLQDCSAQFPTHPYQCYCHSSVSRTSIWLTVPFHCTKDDKSPKPDLQVLCYPINKNPLLCGFFFFYYYFYRIGINLLTTWVFREREECKVIKRFF